jgi:hypothetical protein
MTQTYDEVAVMGVPTRLESAPVPDMVEATRDCLSDFKDVLNVVRIGERCEDHVVMAHGCR